MRNLVADLAAIVGPAQVLVEPEVVTGYATDWTRRYAGQASCVVRPGSADEGAAAGGGGAAGRQSRAGRWVGSGGRFAGCGGFRAIGGSGGSPGQRSVPPGQHRR